MKMSFTANSHTSSMLSIASLVARRDRVEHRVNRGLAAYLRTAETRTVANQRLRPFVRLAEMRREAANATKRD